MQSSSTKHSTSTDLTLRQCLVTHIVTLSLNKDAGSGAPDTGSGAQDAGSGAQDAGSGTPDAGPGVWRAGFRARYGRCGNCSR